MTQYYEVTTPLGGGEYMFRGFTSDPSYQYPGCKTFLAPVSEERMRDTQKYNPGYETLLTMTAPKFTPGPLEVSHERNKFDSTFDSLTIIAPDGIVLATVNVPAFAPHLEEPIANAYLYAGAPDLYAALEACEELMGKLSATKVSTARLMARAALAKARGMKGGA